MLSKRDFVSPHPFVYHTVQHVAYIESKLYCHGVLYSDAKRGAEIQKQIESLSLNPAAVYVKRRKAEIALFCVKATF